MHKFLLPVIEIMYRKTRHTDTPNRHYMNKGAPGLVFLLLFLYISVTEASFSIFKGLMLEAGTSWYQCKSAMCN